MPALDLVARDAVALDRIAAKPRTDGVASSCLIALRDDLEPRVHCSPGSRSRSTSTERSAGGSKRNWTLIGPRRRVPRLLRVSICRAFLDRGDWI
jgi:hypothetical protein